MMPMKVVPHMMDPLLLPEKQVEFSRKTSYGSGVITVSQGKREIVPMDRVWIELQELINFLSDLLTGGLRGAHTS